MEETGILGENRRPVTSHWQTLSNKVVSSTPRHERDSNSQLIAQVVVNPITLRSLPGRFSHIDIKVEWE